MIACELVINGQKSSPGVLGRVSVGLRLQLGFVARLAKVWAQSEQPFLETTVPGVLVSAPESFQSSRQVLMPGGSRSGRSNAFPLGAALGLMGLFSLPAAAADLIIDLNPPVTQVIGDLPPSANTGYIIVGDTISGQKLLFESSYTNSLLILSHTTTSTDNTVVVKGVGTVYQNVAGVSAITGPALSVGFNSSGNKLTIESGASVIIYKPDASSAYDIHIGTNKGADKNQLVVTGTGSSLVLDPPASNTNTIYLGYAGSENSFDILSGGSVVARQMRIGGGSGSLTGNAGATPSNNILRVDGAGSSLLLHGTLNIGASGGVIGGSNQFVISNGGIATVGITNNSSLKVGQDNGSNDNILRVTGSGSSLSVYDLLVGNGSNSGNRIEVSDAGQVVATNLISIGNNSVYLYGLGGSKTALTRSVAGMQIGSNVLVKPFISSFTGVNVRTTILSTDTNPISGSFAGLDLTLLKDSFFAQLDPHSKRVDLVLTARLGYGVNLTTNQQSVASGINQAFNNGAALAPQFTTLFVDPQPSQLGRALQSLSGEAATGAQQGAFQIGNSFLNLLSNPDLAALQPASTTETGSTDLRGPNGWFSGYGGTANLNGNPLIGSQNLSITAGGGAVGA